MVNITNIDPNTLTLQTISPEDVAIIPNFDITSSFNPVTDRVEYFVYDFNNNLLSSNNDLRSYKPSSIDPTGSIIDIVLFPEEDIVKAGYSTGIVKSIYNFISPQVGSADNPLFISEISPSRTELRLSSNNNLLFDTSDLINTTFLSGSAYELYTEFRQNVENSNYLDEFYLNFGNNIYVIGVNSVLEYNSQNNTISLLIKLYEPLPTSIGLKTELSVVTKRAESVAYQIDFTQEETILDSTIKLSGPNYNIPIKDETGPLTQYQNYSSITSTSLSGSLFQLMNQISASSIDINVDYTDYEDFIFFSSAYQRLYNFKEKVTKISSSQAQLNLLYSNITGPTSASIVVSSSKLLLEKEIETTITSFDGYEYFLYYTSGSYAWPKSNAQAPYTLYPPTSTQAINWYATQSAVAVEYDENNQNNLEYVVPEYIRFNSSNTNYMLFTNMIGQFFDEIWLYTKAITAKLDANSNLYQGVSKDVVSTVLESLGTKIYDSTYTLENIYSSLIGLSANGNIYPTTGSALITNYITASVSSPEDIPTIDDFVRLSYKKIYNALPYLLKKKGTNAGLRSLINIFGIPDTILQINEFGGKNKVGNNDWDYWQDKFNYKLDIDGSDGSFVDIPWSINSLWGTQFPNSLQFRFKTLGLDSAIIRPSQSLWNLDNTGDTAIILEYTGSGYLSGSYSGSIPSGSNEYATLKFIPNYTAAPTISASIYLPFYDGGWWSVMVTKNDDDFVLYAANKIYNGNDGFIIGYTGSSTASATGIAWESGTNAYFGANSTLTIGSKSYVNFSGSYQEVRYYNTILPSGTFYDYTMNPYSIEGVGINGAYDQLAFRGTLGNDLYTSSKSMHPKITGSYITQSFASNSNFTINNGTFSVNKEFVFQDQIPAGMRNAVSKKIKNISTTLPYSGSEEVNLPVNTVLSPFIPIDQDSYNSSSYVEDVKYVEVVFSPQNEINEDINAQIGYFNIGDYIGDPRLVSSSAETYPELDALSKDYFDKYYSNYNLWDYIRLIRYYDNALFKMVKDYVPVRSSVTTGVLIKQHILERNKYPVPQLDTYTTTSFYGSGSSANPAWDIPFVFQNLEITGSPIQMYTISGSTGGTMPDLFGLTSSEFTGNNIVNITQSWDGINSTPLGLVPFVDSTQMEFYDGELSGSYIEVENGELNEDNPYKLAPTQLVLYDTLGDLTANNPGAGQIYWRASIGYNGFNYFLYVDTLYINEIAKNSLDIETAIGNLNAGNKITFTVTFDVNSVSYTSTVTGTITSVSLQSPSVWKFTFVGGSLSSTTIFNGTNLASLSPFAYDDAFNIVINLDPFLNDTSGFEYSAFNPLIDNAVIARPNFDYFDVDFSSNSITSVNSASIINASRDSGSATPSTTPASNYTIARSANPRYNGSRTSSPTGSRYQSFVNQPMNFGSSIGQVTNVESYCDWFAVFDNISPSFLAYELYIGGTQVSSITVASAVHVTTLIDINGNTIDLSPTNNIIPSSSLFGILDNKVNPLTSNIPLLNSIFPSNIYSGYISAGTASLDTPVSIRQYSFTGSSNVSSGSFKNYQVFSSGAQPDEDTVGPYTFQNIYGKPNETIVLLATGSFITPTGNINGLLVPGNFNPEYSANLLEIAQSAGFFKNV